MAKNNMEELKDLIEQGLIYEDEFIDMYMKVIRDEGFMVAYGNNQDSAKKLIDTLIIQSQEHQEMLNKINQAI